MGEKEPKYTPGAFGNQDTRGQDPRPGLLCKDPRSSRGNVHLGKKRHPSQWRSLFCFFPPNSFAAKTLSQRHQLIPGPPGGSPAKAVLTRVTVPEPPSATSLPVPTAAPRSSPSQHIAATEGRAEAALEEAHRRHYSLKRLSWKGIKAKAQILSCPLIPQGVQRPPSVPRAIFPYALFLPPPRDIPGQKAQEVP